MGAIIFQPSTPDGPTLAAAVRDQLCGGDAVILTRSERPQWTPPARCRTRHRKASTLAACERRQARALAHSRGAR